MERKTPHTCVLSTFAEAASSFVPSAEDATEFQYPFVITFVVHVTPPSVETPRRPTHCPAIKVLPLADEAIHSQSLVPKPVNCQVCEMAACARKHEIADANKDFFLKLIFTR